MAEPAASGRYVAAFASVNPELTEIARRIMKDYPEYEVVTEFGCLLRAAVCGALAPVRVYGPDEAELRNQEPDHNATDGRQDAEFRETVLLAATGTGAGRLPGVAGVR